MRESVELLSKAQVVYGPSYECKGAIVNHTAKAFHTVSQAK